MARSTRFFLPGATYHVMFRGNNKQHIFSSDEDCSRFCILTEDGIKQFGHSILAFCLMGNHVHLAIQVNDIPLSKICQNLAFRYTQIFNSKYKMTGHLFQGRFKAVLIDSDDYLKELIRYIHLNPIRAKMVNAPLFYPWSSHAAYFNKDFAWLAKDVVLRRFGETRYLAREAFRHFVSLGIGLESKIDFSKGFSDGILGDEEFIEEIKRNDKHIQNLNVTNSGELKNLISFVASWYNVELNKLLQSADKKSIHIRAVIAFLVRNTEHLSLRDLANAFERKESGICHSARRFEVKMQSSIQLQMELEKLKTGFSNATKIS